MDAELLDPVGEGRKATSARPVRAQLHPNPSCRPGMSARGQKVEEADKGRSPATLNDKSVGRAMSDPEFHARDLAEIRVPRK